MDYKMPAPWKKGELRPSEFSSQINALIKSLVAEESLEPFQPLALALQRELEEGMGVVFVPQSAFAPFTLEEKKTVFFKFCQFLGRPVPINKAGELIREVKDTGLKDSVQQPVRGHLTDQSLAFHSDRADLTAMVCDSVSASGGEFKIGSSAYLCQKLKACPEILHRLSQAIPHDLRDEGSGEAAICAHPIIVQEGAFAVRYIRKFIESTVRHGLRVDADMTAALDQVDAMINAVDFYEEIVFSPGDLIVFNNHLTLHARNAFVDSPTQKRCLLRIWIAPPTSRPLPTSFAPIFHAVEAGAYRGGVVGQ